jgi:hypothetical protein
MNPRPLVIEIEELLLTGNPELAAIESAVLRSLGARGIVGDIVEPKAEIAIAREVTRSVVNAVTRRSSY